jgi:hypothetical protein
MAVCDECFQKFLHPLIHESMEKNNRLREKHGQHERWDWDCDSATLTFSDAGQPKLRIQCSVVGTTQGDSWEWSWANSNIPAHEKSDIERVREFGEAEGFDKLTSKFLDADEYTGWEMTAVAAHVLGAPGSYRFPTEHGYCYLVYREIVELGDKFSSDLHGAMRGKVQVARGVDLTEPKGEVWDAESES